jgi:hypothetical protein
MKNKILFGLLLFLGACAKERTTTHFSTQGQAKPAVGEPITYVLTNEDYEKQQQQKKSESNLAYTTIMKENFEQKDLEILFQSLNAPETTLGTPEGVICEFIPQLRVQKTIGRLSCVKQTAQTSNEELLKESTKYTCTVNFNQNKDLDTADQQLFDAITIPAVEDEHGFTGIKTMSKKIGRFHCEQMTKLDTGEVRYECSTDAIFTNSETESTP